MAYISDCTVHENGADGIKYVHSDERPDDKLDRTDVFDLCTFPTTASQTFPVTISMEQSKYAPNVKRCPQVSGNTYRTSYTVTRLHESVTFASRFINE